MYHKAVFFFLYADIYYRVNRLRYQAEIYLKNGGQLTLWWMTVWGVESLVEMARSSTVLCYAQL